MSSANTPDNTNNSRDIERLQRLCADGDSDALDALLTLSVRRNDLALTHDALSRLLPAPLARCLIPRLYPHDHDWLDLLDMLRRRYPAIVHDQKAVQIITQCLGRWPGEVREGVVTIPGIDRGRARLHFGDPWWPLAVAVYLSDRDFETSSTYSAAPWALHPDIFQSIYYMTLRPGVGHSALYAAKNLHTLRLPHNSLSDDLQQHIFNAGCGYLTHLNLSNNTKKKPLRLHWLDGSPIQKTLTHLDLTANDLTARAIQNICCSHSPWPALEVLHLSCNPNTSAEAIDGLCNIQRFPKLRALHLAACDLTDAHATQLYTHNLPARLETLNLLSNPLTPSSRQRLRQTPNLSPGSLHLPHPTDPNPSTCDHCQEILWSIQNPRELNTPPASTAFYNQHPPNDTHAKWSLWRLLRANIFLFDSVIDPNDAVGFSRYRYANTREARVELSFLNSGILAHGFAPSSPIDPLASDLFSILSGLQETPDAMLAQLHDPEWSYMIRAANNLIWWLWDDPQSRADLVANAIHSTHPHTQTLSVTTLSAMHFAYYNFQNRHQSPTQTPENNSAWLALNQLTFDAHMIKAAFTLPNQTPKQDTSP